MTTLGLIGLGRIGAFHTETLMNLPELDGLVITDERPDVVKEVTAKYGATPVNSVAELLSSGVDGVVVAAATPAHAALTLAAVEAGLPTFCEKPVAASAEESAHVADVIARSGVPVQIGYQRRFDAAFAAAKAAVDGGTLGALHTVRSTTMDPAPPPLDYIKGSGGIFRDCAVHDFDTVRWITGQEAVEVYATGSVQGDPLFTEYGDVDTAAVVVPLRSSSSRKNAATARATIANAPAGLAFVALGWSRASFNGAPIPDRELNGYYIIVATAGHDTTSASTAGAMMELARNPALFERFRAAETDKAGLIEEAVRWTTPVQHFMRSAVEDTELNGQQIKAGDWMMLCYASGNRDEAVFDDPFTFNPDRAPNTQIGFGFGGHVCLGQHLARMEMRILMEELLPRLASVELTGEPARVEQRTGEAVLFQVVFVAGQDVRRARQLQSQGLIFLIGAGDQVGKARRGGLC